jgi:hypothetical protein
MDEHVEAFLRETLLLAGLKPSVVSHGVRDRLAECEGMFRDAEPDGSRKDEAARRCQNLCRQRAVDELERHTDSAADHLDAVLRAIDLRRRSKKSAIGDGRRPRVSATRNRRKNAVDLIQ